ncbi:MAG: cupredoxin domain-containing protein [Candidatus Eremiobacteraeota bacterium]|nr:cupredoxin domain-containing protein [Candidatus Eremiobacteraeota bacterium]
MVRVMMKLVWTLALIATFAGAGIVSGSAAPSPVINIDASNWKFTPSTIQVHAGQPTTLHLISTEGVHGIQSEELGIPMTAITGSAKTVVFTPEKTGKYVLHCAIMCGAGHANMTLTINVVP